MNRMSALGRGIAFAALAAVGWLPWLLVTAPLVTAGSARAAYLVACAVAYVAAIAPRPRRRLVGACAGLSLAAMLLTSTIGELALALAVTIALFRTIATRPRPTARSIAAEAILIGSGLLLGRFLAASWLPSTAAAIWGFFLVQSLYTLCAPEPKGHHVGHERRFDEIYRRATELLDRAPTTFSGS